jgi:hypothetical protein
MQRIVMTGIRSQRLLAADLGVEVTSGLHMAKTGLIERVRDRRTGTVRSRLGFAVGCRAVAAVHRYVSK